MLGFSGLYWLGAKNIGSRRKGTSVEKGWTPKLFKDFPLAARKHGVMDNWSDRRTVSPITLEVHRETADGMGAVRAHYHQGWSTDAHYQAGYRRAVRSRLFMTSTNLAPPGASI